MNSQDMGVENSDSGFKDGREQNVPKAACLIRKKRSNLRRKEVVKDLTPINLLAKVCWLLSKEDEHTLTSELDAKVDQSSQASCHDHSTACASEISGSSIKKKKKNVSDSRKALAIKNDFKGKGKREEKKVSSFALDKNMAMRERNPPKMICSDNSIQFVHRDRMIPSDRPFPTYGSSDEEENSSECTHMGPIPAEPARDRRDRKIQPSKFWTTGPTPLPGEQSFVRDMDVDGKEHRKQDRTEVWKRKPQISPVKNAEGIISDEEAELNKLTAVGTITTTRDADPRDSKVRLRIKSLITPEMGIDLPENATVGFMKKTMLRKLRTMLRNRLSVAMIVQGKKVRDDSPILQHAKFTGKESLMFTFEPIDSPSPEQIYPDTESRQTPVESPEQLARFPGIRISEFGSTSNSKDIASSSGDSSIHLSPRTNRKSQLLALPPPPPPPPLSPASNNVADDSLAMVLQPKKTEVAQRRIRRPFSVAEVEALVTAVEKLGTGRWRDVKLRAFDQAPHRTYVDLKDKWKTLVHTAKIAPQQRRGEPVPQELLDRVQAAHAYWSHHQGKPHQKKDQCLLQL